MHNVRLGLVESRFAQIVWDRAPLTTKELLAICAQEFNWKRTTTYTVLKKLCERGIFKMEDSVVTVLISKEKFQTIQSEHMVNDTFEGSLPAFIAAFTARNTLTPQEVEQIQQMIDAAKEGK